jgi:hypothetical protein
MHDGKKWHWLFSPFLVYSSSHAARMAHWPVKKSEGGLDRPVEAMCQNVTKNSQRPITGKLGGKILPL